MDIKRLRTFVAVADLGTVSKAALRLRISQSALSGRSPISRTNAGSGYSTGLAAVCS
jgi:Bacterial regulatory helix-turn-helix protein, lysR family